MPILAPLLNLFHHKTISKEEQQQKNTINNLISYCISLINREDLVFETIESYRTLNSDEERLDTMQYMSIYISLEQFITGNKKPTVKVEFSRQQLRDEVRKHVMVEELPALFRVLFIPNKYQRISLYEIGVKMVMKEVERNFGSKLLTDIYAKEIRGTVLQPTLLSDGAISFSGLYKDAQSVSDEQITFAFTRLFAAFYAQLRSSVGVETAKKPFTEFYQLVKKNYEYDHVLDVIEVLPGDITQDDRLEFLSKEQLKKQIIEATSQLQNERDQAKAVVEALGEGLLVIDAELRITQVNPTTCKLLGITPDEAIGRPLNEVFPLYQDQATVLSSHRPIANVLRKGKAISSAVVDGYASRSQKGRIFPIIFSATPIRSGGKVTGAVEVFRDITDINRYEQELRLAKATVEQKVVDRTRQLRETQNRLFTFLDKMPLGVVIFDQGKRLNFANSTIINLIKRTTGSNVLSIGDTAQQIFSQLALFNRKTRSVFPPDHNLLEPVFDGRPVHSRDIEIRSGEKSVPIEVYATPLFNEQGRVNFVIVVTKDITEELILERSKDEFFSIASHELRTPLTAIRGNTSLIQEYFGDKVTDPELKEMIQDIHQSSVQLIGIVNDFLNVSRLEQGKMKFERQEFDLQEVVKSVLLEYEKSAQEKGLFLLCDNKAVPPGRRTIVVADQTKTKEVLVNLVGNGLKYTEKGGVVLSCLITDRFLRVRIADTGRGIAPEGQKLLFHKFQQTGNNLYTRDTTKSTGLGLYISKMIAEGMGGKVFLEYSEPGKGSIFSFDLPLVK